MQTDVSKGKTLPAATIEITASKMFTFPTRLADSWGAEGQEITLPGSRIGKDAITISAHSGSTDRHLIPTRNLRRLLSRRFGAPIRRPGEYLLDARGDTDLNMAHILTNVAPGLLAARELFAPISVILRAGASAMARAAYDCLGFPVICTDNDVCGNVVDAPDGRDGAYEAWYADLFGATEFAGYNPHTPELVFLSRRGGRSLLNEQEVEAELRPRGFQKFYLEDLSIAEQWSIGRNARAVAGVHGAALSCLLFNRNRPRVLELFHPGYVVRIYRHLTNVMGGTWCGITGQMPHNIIRDLDGRSESRRFAYSPIRIDIGSLRRGLEYLGQS